ncbi:MAG: hypothetical protein IT436_01310 [Phycisphaerales bacterium]|nr:hypothetical protein [Phycisphaerales bacterium]
MNQTRKTRFGARMLVMIAGLAGCVASTAHAQSICDLVYRPDLPDFDQKREAATGYTGLPNDGRMYCVPTSCIDQQAYLANHGYPNAVSPSYQGPRDWQNANVNTMTFYINQMGTYMDTDPFDGTDGSYLDGWTEYLQDRVPIYWVSYSTALAPDNDIKSNYPETLANMLRMGALVNLSIGWFELRHGEVTYWERTGGHCTALSGTINACDSQPTLLWRDPSSGDSKTSQSHFTNSMSSMTFVTAYFSWKDDSSTHARSTWRLNAYNGGDSFGYVGGYKAIWPNFGVGIDTVVGKIKFHFPSTPKADGASLTQVHDFSALGVTGVPQSIDLSPDMTWSAVLASSPGFLAPKKLIAVNQADGSVRLITTLSAFAGQVVFSPRGELFVADFNQLKKIDPETGAVIATGTITNAITSLTYDDANDRILALSQLERTIDTFSPGAQPIQSLPLPTAVAVGLNSSIAINPLTGKPWIAYGDSQVCYELTMGPTAITATSKSLSGATAPRHIQFSAKGEALVLDNGLIREYGIDPGTGRYNPTSRTGMSGLAFGGPFRMAKNRTSYNPATIHLFEDIDLEPAIVPDCFVDLNGDALVDFADYLEFLNYYEQLDPRADFNFDGLVDFVDYLEFLNQYDEGC